MSASSDYVARILAEAPPLKPEQRAKLAELLRPVMRPATRTEAPA